jgi:hypothetical protein
MKLRWPATSARCIFKQSNATKKGGVPGTSPFLLNRLKSYGLYRTHRFSYHLWRHCLAGVEVDVIAGGVATCR